MVDAMLQTGPLETRYHRDGAGRPAVLLLFPGALADPLGAALFARLAARFRVIAPVVPAGVGPGGVPVARWLRDVIDGLGLERPSVVADEALVGALLGFSLVDPGRVAGIVAVCREDADPASSVGMLHAARGLLVVAVDAAWPPAACADAAVEEMIPFLVAEDARA